MRLWLRGEGFRSIKRMVQLDRKTVRRYLVAAEALRWSVTVGRLS